MDFSIQYKPLFKVNIFHQFFLNKGLDEFKNMNVEKRMKQLDKYVFQAVFNVIPTHETYDKLNGQKLVFKKGNTGFVVWSEVTGNNMDEPFIKTDDDMSFTFLLKINDFSVFNYTDLNEGDARKLLYFSNKRPASEPNNFPLIDKAGGNHHVSPDFILSETTEMMERKLLDKIDQKSLIGIIRIFIKGDAASLNITDVQNKVSEPPQTFELNFKNRKTIWRYFFNDNQQVTGGDDVKKENGNAKILVTKAEQPLTQTGFVSVELGGVELPNPDTRLVKPDTSTNKYYSEIYM